ncbi:hypothetical protein CTAYLR_005486 [Chrysophaeum taylorii]|uniref:sn-1-specific diacylglycerol lipase n=1 Tax=Chrysophaeum taylorii TaxID=2483200 RepID=A0AAD7U5R0_9STRA|nr:hypothetical protein CTAYLR_005486 [Chrysophaeum taylorii]
MPGLVLKNRRFALGSDDLAFPAGCLALLRVCWTSCLCAYIAHVIVVKKGKGCGMMSGVAGVFLTLLGLGVSSIVANAFLAYHSSRGVILARVARARIPEILLACCGLGACEAVATGVAMWLAWAPRNASPCTRAIRGDDWERVMLRAIATTQACGLTSTVAVALMVFDPRGSRKVARGSRSLLRVGDHLEVAFLKTSASEWAAGCAAWCSCFRRATCGLFGGKTITDSSVDDVASLLAMFMGSLDVVATDVIAGLALVRARQPSAATPNTPVDDDSIATDAAAHVDFAMAVYGWKLAAYASPFKALKDAAMLFARRARGGCCDTLDSIALRRVAACGARRRVIFETFRAEPNRRVPVAVFVDDDLREIVVACRGTLSLDDCVTDATARPVEIPATFSPRRSAGGGFAHAGMLGVAIELLKLVSTRLSSEASRLIGYEIVVVGHSLGAGVAALLALALRSSSDFPSTRCVAFSPPGALVDQELALAMRSFCTSVVVGDDLVPRLGLKSLFDLRDRVIEAVADCRVHKRFAIASSLDASPDPRVLFHDPASDLGAEAARLSAACLACLRENESREVHQRLALPGRVLHVVVAVLEEEEEEEVRWWWRRRPRLVAVEAPATLFSDVRISRRMFKDHMPWNVLAAVRQIAAPPPSRHRFLIPGVVATV